MRTEFVKALQDASEHRESAERIKRIKRAVTGEIRAADPAAAVKYTDYFNHAMVPDIVLRWPGDSSERFVFVRPYAEAAWLSHDIATLGQNQPIIFTLGDIVESSASERANLAEEATAASTWVAGPATTERVATARKSSAVVGLLGQALVRGGRGLSTEGSIASLTTNTEAGFSAAALQDVEPLAETVGAIEGSLNATQAGRLTRILAAVWEGHGGQASNFPTVASKGPLTDDDLTYLMKSLDTAEPEFWQRVGRTVKTEQIARLRLEDAPSRSLQSFMEANLDHLMAKGIRVTHQSVRLDEPQEFPRWLIEKGCLSLRGREWVAYLAARKADEFPPAEEGAPVAFSEFKERASRPGVVVTGVDFAKGDREFKYQSKERLDILDDADLAQVADGVVADVEIAHVTIAGSGTVAVDFTDRTAVAPTNSTLPVSHLTGAVLPLLVRLDDAEGDAIASFEEFGEPTLEFPQAPEE